MGKLGSTENGGETKHFTCLAVMRLPYLTVFNFFFCNAISMRSTISIMQLWWICLSSFFTCWQVLFHCFFIACIIYNFVILCSLVAFRPGNILDICEWILFLEGFVSLNADNDAIILYWHLLHSSLSGGNRFWNSTLGEKIMCKWDGSRGRYLP